MSAATSFPYLAIAKQYGVDYWMVLQFADLLDVYPPAPADWALPHSWMVATCLAWRHEADRRQASMPDVIITVRGDCGVIHGNVEEWQNCAVCASIIKRRTTI